MSDILLFIAHLHKESLSAASIVSYLSALAYLHKIKGLFDPTKHFVVSKAIAGCRRFSKSHDVRMPITMPVLRTLLQALPSVAVKAYERHMLCCMFSLAFHAFLRIGEIAATSANNTNDILQFSDVHMPKLVQEHCTITLRKFKHIGAQGPQTFVLKRHSSKSNNNCCPVHLLRRYLACRGTKKGPLFILQSGKPFLRRQFDAALKSVLKFSGYSTTLYKGHSFRIGAATEAAARGCSDAQIRNLGRWRTDAFRKYIRLSIH